MENYMDIDIYGREDTPGIAKELLNEDAIKNALILFLTSKKNEFLYRPDAGGIINNLVFRKVTEDSLRLLKFKIVNSINIEFFPAISLTDVTLESDVENRVLKVYIEYEGQISKELEKLEFYAKTDINSTKYTYIEVIETGDNLYNFCVTNKPSLAGKKLIYDTGEQAWVWGNFKLVNLLPIDPRFYEILEYING